MSRIIKNQSRNKVDTNYNGKHIVIKPKGSLTVEDDKTGEALADYLLNTFHFLYDITPEKTYPVGEVKKAKGVKPIK